MSLIAERPQDWVTYWEGLAEGRLLFQEEAKGYFERLSSSISLDPQMTVLDFGCGYGFVAEMLAPKVGSLYCWDAASSMRAFARKRLSGVSSVYCLESLENAEPRSLPGFDLILVNSVIQYLTEEALVGWLTRWRALLAPGGRVVISDISQPGHSAARDVLSLLTFSFRRGYLVKALRNVLAERSRYDETKRICPLFQIDVERLTGLASESGLSTQVLSRNLTHFSSRKSVILSSMENLG